MASYTWSSPVDIAHAINPPDPLVEGCSVTLEPEHVPISLFSGQNYGNLQWNGKKLNLPAQPNPLLFGSVRGSDIPIWPKDEEEKRGHCGYCERPTVRAQGTLVVQKDDIKFELGGPKYDATQGQIKWHIQCESQLPSLTVDYKYGATKIPEVSHRIRFFGNKSVQSVSYFTPGDIQAGVTDLEIPHHHKTAAEHGCCMAIRFQFGRLRNPSETRNALHRYANSMLVLHDGKIDRWKSEAAMKEAFDNHVKGARVLKGFDLMVFWMVTANDLSVTLFRDAPLDRETYLQSWIPQYRYWCYVMKLSCRFGPCWFYTMQREPGVHSTGEQVANQEDLQNSPPVAFWLVKKFQASITNGQLALRPITWGQIIQDPKWEPQKESILTQDMASYMRKLGLLRVSLWQRDTLQQSENVTAYEANEVAPYMRWLSGRDDWWTTNAIDHIRYGDATSSALSESFWNESWPTPAESASIWALTNNAGSASASRQSNASVCSWCFSKGHESLDCRVKLTALQHDTRAADYFRRHPDTNCCGWYFELGHDRSDCTAVLDIREHKQRREAWELKGPASNTGF